MRPITAALQSVWTKALATANAGIEAEWIELAQERKALGEENRMGKRGCHLGREGRSSRGPGAASAEEWNSCERELARAKTQLQYQSFQIEALTAV